MFKEIIFPPKGKDEYSFIRVIFWVFLIYYSLRFFSFGINKDVMNHYIHSSNLVIHELGHLLFYPFGKFITILGGSILQCLVPIIIILYFLFKEYNPFGASIGLWWLGQNLTDIALYISDASERSLPLIGGLGKEAHDWGNLLTMMGLLDYDFLFGIIIHYIGMLLMIIAILWGFYIHKNAYTKKIPYLNK
ncbi:MAG: hypothetical protein PHV23_00305 [Candidatus Gracilibacteria bacterium]|nr:hypothetical protein [Candidatus Gracilibacteria bacterium]